MLTSASQASSQPPSGSLLSSTSPNVPPGYSLLNVSTTGGNWIVLGNMPTAADCITATALLNGQIWVIGGRNGGGILKLIQINYGGELVGPIALLSLPSGRCGHATVDVLDQNQDALFIMGGVDDTGSVLKIT